MGLFDGLGKFLGTDNNRRINDSMRILDDIKTEADNDSFVRCICSSSISPMIFSLFTPIT